MGRLLRRRPSFGDAPRGVSTVEAAGLHPFKELSRLPRPGRAGEPGRQDGFRGSSLFFKASRSVFQPLGRFSGVFGGFLGVSARFSGISDGFSGSRPVFEPQKRLLRLSRPFSAFRPLRAQIHRRHAASGALYYDLWIETAISGKPSAWPPSSGTRSGARAFPSAPWSRRWGWATPSTRRFSAARSR